MVQFPVAGSLLPRPLRRRGRRGAHVPRPCQAAGLPPSAGSGPLGAGIGHGGGPSDRGAVSACSLARPPRRLGVSRPDWCILLVARWIVLIGASLRRAITYGDDKQGLRTCRGAHT